MLTWLTSKGCYLEEMNSYFFSKFDLNHRHKGVLFFELFISRRSGMTCGKLKVLQSILLKWSRDWYQKIDILKKWLHNFCANLIWTIDLKEFVFYGSLLIERSNLANINVKWLILKRSSLFRAVYYPKGRI